MARNPRSVQNFKRSAHGREPVDKAVLRTGRRRDLVMNSDQCFEGINSVMRFPGRWGYVAGAFALALGGCNPGANLPMVQSPSSSAGYRLSTGDQIRIITFNEPGLSGEFGIDDSGYVALPLLGPIAAEGLTTRALAAKLSASLHEKNLLNDPSIVVEVVKYRPVFVLGEVQHPGPFPFVPHMTMLSAVALAGGYTPRAVKSRAEVIRTEDGATVKGRVEPDSVVEPGDIITVFERTF
jgi:polysaccharide export outer membrane protein